MDQDAVLLCHNVVGESLLVNISLPLRKIWKCVPNLGWTPAFWVAEGV